MIILYHSLWYGQRISSRRQRWHEMRRRNSLSLSLSPPLSLSLSLSLFADALDAARVITDSRKIKKAIAWKSKIAESNGAWKWNPRLLSTLWKSFLDIGKRRETPSMKGELIDYKPIIRPHTHKYVQIIFLRYQYIFSTVSLNFGVLEKSSCRNM